MFPGLHVRNEDPAQPLTTAREELLRGGIYVTSNQNLQWTQKPCIPLCLHTILGSDDCSPAIGDLDHDLSRGVQ